MEILKLLSTSQIFAQVIGFFILFLLLRVFAWKRLIKLLDERKERIASGLRQVEDSKAEVNRLKSEYDQRIISIDKESRKLIQEAIDEGKKLSEEIRKNAHLEADRIIKKARQDVEYELDKAKSQIKDQIIDLSIAAAEAVIQDKLSEEEDRRIVKNFIDKIDTIEEP